MHEQIRLDILELWARCVTRRPWLTLIVCLLLAAGGVTLAVTRMEFVADRSHLVDPQLGWNARYFMHKEHFEHWDDVVIAIDGPVDADGVDEVARLVARELRTSPLVRSADAGFPIDSASPRLFRAAPQAEYERRLAQFAQGQALVEQAPNANAALRTLVEDMRAGDEATPTGGMSDLARILSPFINAAIGQPIDFENLRPVEADWQPFVALTGRIRYIQVGFVETEAGIDALSSNVAWLREEVARLISEYNTEGLDLSWGVTGIPAIEADETAQSIADSTRATVFALVLISMLLIIVYRGVRVPLLAVIALLIGVAWSFGWLILTVGHLQLLSVVFSVILLGLGIDFAVHLIARLELVQDEHDSLSDAVARVFHGIGPGMITGAVTTAVAFGATALTKFRGMAEMGIIAGGGILLCLIAMLSAFPASLQLTGRWKQIIRHRHGGEEAHFAHGRLDFVDKMPLVTLIVALVICAAAFVPALRVSYDPNVLNLHPPGIESVIWERRILEQDGQSVWAGIMHTSADEAPELVDELRTHSAISDVGAMGILFPANRDARSEQIAAIRNAPTPLIDVSAGPDALRGQFSQINVGLRTRMSEMSDADRAIAEDMTSRLTLASATLRDLPEADARSRWNALDVAYQVWRSEIATTIETALSPGPLVPEDLPRVLRERWIGDDGRWLITASPSADPLGRSILHPERLETFVQAMFAVSDEALGPPVQIYESSQLIQREYFRAAIYALVAILFVLLIDFRSLVDALCALLPVGVGFLGMFAMMGLVGMPINFANIIVMPLIFGIGVDAGVHMVHRWKIEPFGEPAGLSGGTGRGITVTMITTCIGFGCMLIAEHRGIRSLGFVMVVGLAVTLLACWMVLPAILRMRHPHTETNDQLG